MVMPEPECNSLPPSEVRGLSPSTLLHPVTAIAHPPGQQRSGKARQASVPPAWTLDTSPGGIAPPPIRQRPESRGHRYMMAMVSTHSSGQVGAHPPSASSQGSPHQPLVTRSPPYCASGPRQGSHMSLGSQVRRGTKGEESNHPARAGGWRGVPSILGPHTPSHCR
jgi:hypothetical protein